jgi:L-alanine-DL-glutamate epimerase-like enolase superfamily enzyme
VPERIVDIHAATARAALPEPIHFGDWVMKHREFTVVRVRAESGVEGFGFTLSREGPVAATIKQAIAHHYVGAELGGIDDAAQVFYRCQASNLAALSGGIGLRALSIVDLAVHDLLARSADVSIARYLGGEPRALPATAIIGYPPGAMPPDAVAAQVRELRDAGWRRFKIPIALPLDYGRDRLFAAREAAGDDAWLGMDAAWIFRSVDDAAAFLDGVRDARLDWFEDVFPPGDAGIVADLRSRSGGTPIAMGDEQGGSYYPEALLLRKSVDVVRIDLTCMGGITRARPTIEACERAGTAFAPHMFAHVHSQVFGALGYDVPVEWGVPGTGVDQYADSLAQPTIVENGLMEPLPEQPGFGRLVNGPWLAEQDVDDPDGLIRELAAAG